MPAPYRKINSMIQQISHVLKIKGFGDYFLKFYFDDCGNCIYSCDSDGKAAGHVFDGNYLIQTNYLGSGFIKQWYRKNGELINYSDSNGLIINFSDLPKPDGLYGFHGTSISCAEKIKDTGYIKHVDKHWEQSTGNMFVFSNLSGLYSDEYCFNMAKKFAIKTSEKYNEDGVIVKVDMLGLETRKYSVDYYDPSYEIMSSVPRHRILEIKKIS